MTNEPDRSRKEMESLFKDPKFARQAFRAVGAAIAASPCNRTVGQYDKDGNPTLNNDIEEYSYNKLKKDIQSLGKPDREPTELELIMQCQMVRARFDTGAAIFVRDTLGAKPIDESKIDANVTNVYEALTDEELELIADARAAKRLAASEPTDQPTDQSTSLVNTEVSDD